VLLDMPGNVDRRSPLVVAGLVMSDFVLIPIEPNQISLTALPDTFELIHYARDLGGDGTPAVVGMVLNKTDRRTQQFRSKMPEILKAATLGELPPILENLLPDTPKLATSTDETLGFRTLRVRFDTYHDNVRKVACELEERCAGRIPLAEPQAVRFAPVIRGILDKFARRKARSSAKRQAVEQHIAIRAYPRARQSFGRAGIWDFVQPKKFFPALMRICAHHRPLGHTPRRLGRAAVILRSGALFWPLGSDTRWRLVCSQLSLGDPQVDAVRSEPGLFC
jgi:hypothetical protein